MKSHLKFCILILTSVCTACIPTASEPVWTKNLGNNYLGIEARTIDDATFVIYSTNNGTLTAQPHNYSDGAAAGELLTLDPEATGTTYFSSGSSNFYVLQATRNGFKLSKYDSQLNPLWSVSDSDIPEWVGADLSKIKVLPSVDGESVMIQVEHDITKLDALGNQTGYKRFYDSSRPNEIPKIEAETDNQELVLIEFNDQFISLDSEFNPLGQFSATAYRHHQMHIYDGHVYDGAQSAGGTEFCKLDYSGNVVWCHDPVIDSAYGEYLHNKGETYALDMEPFLSLSKFDTDGELLWSKTFLNVNTINSVKVNNHGAFLVLGKDLKEVATQDNEGEYKTSGFTLSLRHISPSGVQRTLTLDSFLVANRLNYDDYIPSYSLEDGVREVTKHFYHDGKYLLVNEKTGQGSFENGEVITVIEPHIEMVLYD